MLTRVASEEIFAANPDFDLIIMDACVEGNQPDTLPLVRKIRETFKGPMIAASGNPRYRQWLMEAGCDHESISKHNTHLKILEVLGL